MAMGLNNFYILVACSFDSTRWKLILMPRLDFSFHIQCMYTCVNILFSYSNRRREKKKNQIEPSGCGNWIWKLFGCSTENVHFSFKIEFYCEISRGTNIHTIFSFFWYAKQALQTARTDMYDSWSGKMIHFFFSFFLLLLHISNKQNKIKWYRNNNIIYSYLYIDVPVVCTKHGKHIEYQPLNVWQG